MHIEARTPPPWARAGVEPASSKARRRALRRFAAGAVWGARGAPGPTDVRVRNTTLLATSLPTRRGYCTHFVRCGSR